MTEQIVDTTISITHSYQPSFFFQDLIVVEKNDDSEFISNMTTNDNCEFIERHLPGSGGCTMMFMLRLIGLSSERCPCPSKNNFLKWV
jgi:hypothetical protein